MFDEGRVSENKYLNLAFEMLQEHPYKKDLRYLHAAVLVRGGRILSKGFNKPKRNMFVDIYGYHKGCNLHAEVSAILKVRKKINLIGSKIFVARMRKLDQKSGNSKPCSFCQNVLKKYGIKRAYYTTSNGRYKMMKVH